jgi:exo-1,4-beta-D-glucosaminidase
MKLHLSLATAILCFLSAAISKQALASREAPNMEELQRGWKMSTAKNVSGEEALVSQAGFDASKWYDIQRMPATVLQVLEDHGVYKNLYYGMNLTTPGDIWKQDWWHRTTFTALAGRTVYSLIFKGINYRADIWLNGHKVANRQQAVGIYDRFEFDVTEFTVPGGTNILAVKITSEQAVLGENGVELGDSWLDWLNWKYIGYHDEKRKLDVTFTPDRNAGVWKRVYLSSTGAVGIRNPYVATDLLLPATSPAALTVYCDLRNGTRQPVNRTLYGKITRQGKPAINFQQKVSLYGDTTQEVALTPANFSQFSVADPDLWWPYVWASRTSIISS